jgi:hypothetical protein
MTKSVVVSEAQSSLIWARHHGETPRRKQRSAGQKGRVSGRQTITKNGHTVVVSISLRFLPLVVARFFKAPRQQTETARL